MNQDRESVLSLVRNLSEVLALEYAALDDCELPTIGEGVKFLTAAKSELEKAGIDCPNSVSSVIARHSKTCKR